SPLVLHISPSPHSSFSFSRPVPPRALPSFPTRRSSDLIPDAPPRPSREVGHQTLRPRCCTPREAVVTSIGESGHRLTGGAATGSDRKSTRLNSSHDQISYAVFCLKKKKKKKHNYSLIHY